MIPLQSVGISYKRIPLIKYKVDCYTTKGAVMLLPSFSNFRLILLISEQNVKEGWKFMIVVSFDFEVQECIPGSTLYDGLIHRIPAS